ncbi:MAG: 50S ribosomal protein L10, partial [Candidatus Woykebacteria bacterium RIFCSPLOWO2_01_FULL_43_14]
MATEKKIQTVQELKEKFERAKLTVLTDYRGLSTTDLNSLRNELAELDSEYQITKNTLTARAL